MPAIHYNTSGLESINRARQLEREKKAIRSYDGDEKKTLDIISTPKPNKTNCNFAQTLKQTIVMKNNIRRRVGVNT